jgi:transcriptional regulator with XRE-family HTH domain
MHCVVASHFLFALGSMAGPSKYQRIIGESIRQYRKQAGLSQEKLAEKADLHPVYVGELERGEEAASVYALVKIAKALGVRLRDLVDKI